MPKPYADANREISIGLLEYSSVSLDDLFGEQPDTRPEFGGEKLCFEECSGKTFRRIAFDGETYFVPIDLCDLIKKSSDLRLFDYVPLNGVNFVYGIKEEKLPKETVFSDLGADETAMLSNRLYGSYRGDNPFRSSHGHEHNVEKYYQPW